jgi:hypothetical protein
VFIKSMNLYSRKRILASLLPVLACAGFFLTAAAQKRKAHKLRATAVVEVTTDSKGVPTTHVVPVTILDQGLFNDASTYKATPRPMALDNGIVYEAQNSGIPVGYATITNGTSKDDTWTALGKWSVAKAEPKKSDTAAPVTASGSDDDRPVLHRASGSDSSSNAPASTSSSTDSDRPVLRRPESSATPSPTPAASSTPSSSGTTSSESSDSGRPTLHRPDDSASPAASPAPTPAASSSDTNQSTPEASAPSEDPDRPTLKHKGSKSTAAKTSAAKTASTKGSSSQPSASQPAVAPTSTPAKSTTPKERKPMVISGTRSYAAVSDTDSIDTRSFVFSWKPDEEEEMRPKMYKLALAELPNEHVRPSSDLQKSNLLKNVVLRSFDLDLSNDAVIVFSAEVPGTLPSTKDSAAKFVTRYVTVIARVDFDGNPQKVFASVTDSSRLDVTPRLELIDAVDVDGDGIAELLFRQYGYEDSSFVIYSVGRTSVNKLFEGASTTVASR